MTKWLQNSEYRDFDYSLTPAREDLFDTGDVSYSKANVKPIQSSVFESASSIVSVFKFTCEPNRSLYEVQVKPVQYDLATG